MTVRLLLYAEKLLLLLLVMLCCFSLCCYLIFLMVWLPSFLFVCLFKFFLVIIEPSLVKLQCSVCNTSCALDVNSFH